MTDTLFHYTADLDGDGELTDETVRYQTTYWLPDLDGPDGGRKARSTTIPTLDGEVMVLTQGRAGKADGRAPGAFTLKWEIADPDFLRLSEEDYAKGRLVQVRLDHRWRQCQVTSSGAADRTVTVAAGYLLSGGDTYWLAADAAHVCGASDSYVYATLAAGVATVASGTSVPAGAVQLATITIAANVVTVTADPSGAANARQGYIAAWTPTQAPAGMSGLEMTVQEVR